MTKQNYGLIQILLRVVMGRDNAAARVLNQTAGLQARACRLPEGARVGGDYYVMPEHPARYTFRSNARS